MNKKYFIAIMTLIIMASLYMAIHRSYIQFNSTVSIKNTHWKKVHVQIRKGFYPDPNHDKLIFDLYITMGQMNTFTVDNGDDILYRRDSDPNHADGVHFTSWKYADCGDSSSCIVNNP